MQEMERHVCMHAVVADDVNKRGGEVGDTMCACLRAVVVVVAVVVVQVRSCKLVVIVVVITVVVVVRCDVRGCMSRCEQVLASVCTPSVTCCCRCGLIRGTHVTLCVWAVVVERRWSKGRLVTGSMGDISASADYIIHITDHTIAPQHLSSHHCRLLRPLIQTLNVSMLQG